jgi:hypothetical protein
MSFAYEKYVKIVIEEEDEDERKDKQEGKKTDTNT